MPNMENKRRTPVLVCAFYCNTLDMKKREAAFAGVAAF